MNSKLYRVHVVVDPLYGEKLGRFPSDEPIWIVDTEVNRPVVERLRRERKICNNLEGITSFKTSTDKSREDIFLEELATIDLHHGEYSHDPPYSVLNVIGAACSGTLKEALKEYGFTEYERTAEGFMTWKRAGQQGVAQDRLRSR